MVNFSLALILLVLTLTSCTKEDFTIENLNGNKIIVLGHAGMGLGNTYPMNSFESILSCLNHGADGTEFDVQLTKDSILVLFHDQELSDNTSLNGTVNSLSWDEIKTAHYIEAPFLNYSITSLEHVLKNIKNPGQYTFTFDCKLYSGNNSSRFYSTYINSLIQLIEKYQLGNNVCIESQCEDFLTLLKNKRPDYKLFIYPTDFETGLTIARNLNLYGITISTRDITKEQVLMAHAGNFRVALWNLHSEAENTDAIGKNPDFLQTDKLENLVKLLK